MELQNQTNNKFALVFNKDEALVLFDFIAKINEKGPSQDLVGQQLLWDMESLLERELPEVFDKDYNQLVNESKKKLKG